MDWLLAILFTIGGICFIMLSDEYVSWKECLNKLFGVTMSIMFGSLFVLAIVKLVIS